MVETERAGSGAIRFPVQNRELTISRYTPSKVLELCEIVQTAFVLCITSGCIKCNRYTLNRLRISV